MFGYELGRPLASECPRPEIDEFRMPALAVGLYDVVVAFDHEQRMPRGSSRRVFPRPIRSPPRTGRRAAGAVSRLASGEPPQRSRHSHAISRRLPLERTRAAVSPSGVDGLTSNFSADGYLPRRPPGDRLHPRRRRVSGEPCRSGCCTRPHGSAVDLYCRLRERNPAPFAGYFDGGGWQIASASPERFLRVADGRSRRGRSRAPRPRTARPEADRAGRRRAARPAKRTAPRT